jgi:hypothetical protein
MKQRAPLSRNLITYIGWSMVLATFAIGIVLIAADLLFHRTSPYNALVTYLVIPVILAVGIIIGFIGIAIEWHWRKKGGLEHRLPVVDMNVPKTRREFLVVVCFLAVFFGVSAVGTYRGFVFTESTQFCGAVCHSVMHPEYTAYQHSPHARVACVECHIGEGADWYVRSKISGLRQVFRTITQSFELPIEVPVRNLRPARETCEHCHWPEVFTGTIERVQWHFWNDEENTPSKYHILMKVGGANRETGESEGIHWHTSSREIVRYWPEDRQRLLIPWIEVEYANGVKKVFRSDDAPEGRPPESEIRTMDCIDCHNRPSHIFQPPDVMVNRALAAGTLDRKIPSIKEQAVELVGGDYENTQAALDTIESTVRGDYLELENPGEEIAAHNVDDTISVLKTAFLYTNFPEHGVNWKTHPNHIGHRYFPGCFRCHTEEHQAEDGESISNHCNLCHEFVFQAHGDDAYGPVEYKSQVFQHPGGQEDIWEGSLCTDCHAPE